MNEPFEIDFRTNIDQVWLDLAQIEKRHFPFALGRALTATAKMAVDELKTEMASVFDRPTKYTLNAFAVKSAHKKSREVSIYARDRAGKGNSAYEYLQPEVFGGGRKLKRLEWSMKPHTGGGYIVPGRGAKLDQYGNVSRGQIRQVQSRLKVAEMTLGHMANSTDKTIARLRRKKLTVASTGHRSDMFIARSKRSGRPLGVYQLTGRGRVEPIFIFTQRRPLYKERLDFDGVVRSSFDKNFNTEMRKALDHALATAR